MNLKKFNLEHKLGIQWLRSSRYFVGYINGYGYIHATNSNDCDGSFQAYIII